MKRKSDSSGETKVFSILQKFLKANGGNVDYVALDNDETTIEYNYIQSHVQRGWF